MDLSQKIFFLVFLLFFSNLLKANKIDSLIDVSINQTDTAKASTYIIISDTYRDYGDVEKALIFARKANLIAQNIENEKITVKTDYCLASAYLGVSNLDSAEFFYQNAIKFYHKNSNSSKVAEIYVKLAEIKIYRSKYAEAITDLNNALLVDNKMINAFAYNNKGIIFSELADYPTALDFFLKALKIIENTNSSQKYVAGLHNNIATVYISLNNNDLAKFHLRKALTILDKTNSYYKAQNSILNNLGSVLLSENKADSARFFFQKAYKLNQKIENKELNIITIINLANYYILTDSLDLANAFLEKGEEIIKKYNSPIATVNLFLQKSLFFNKTFQYENAEKTLFEALSICKKNSLKELKLDVYQKIAKNAYDYQNYELAYEYKSKHQQLSDSVFNLEKIRIVENLKAMHDIEQKDNEIKLLKLKNSKQKNRFFAIIGISLLSIMLFISVTYILLLKNINTRQKLEIISDQKKMNELKLENKKAENIKIKLELENKEKEIFLKVSQIIQNNELIKLILRKLKQINKNISPENRKAKKEIQNLLIDIKTQDQKQLWKEFETRFVSVHKNFYKKLSENFPDLTPNERKLCAFLKLNMSTKDIASITLQSQNAIFVARTRLRKKLNLETDENLISFIQSL